MKTLKIFQEWPSGYKDSWKDAASTIAEAIQMKLPELGDDETSVLIEVHLVAKET